MLDMMAKNNARIRRVIAEILFLEGPMTRLRMSALLKKSGEFRGLPNNTALTAMLAKNAQVVQVGHEMVDAGEGVKTKQTIYAIHPHIKEKEDLTFTRPFSTMTTIERNLAVVCRTCSQKRIIQNKWASCLSCQRKSLGS
tara:strand:- start:7194 stop:7613 length:420 start_codon:yes stop_codon:yes gene_type:complete